MSEPIRNVLLVADRIRNADQAGTVRAYVERLGSRGLAARILCSSWGEAPRQGLDVEECPGLADRWRLAWVIRSLRPAVGPNRPDLIHALEVRMSWAGLELAERLRVPYLQGVEEFLPLRSKLRLSRRWCRGLVASSRELGDDLIQSFGIPREWVHVIHTGMEEARPVLLERDPRLARVAVIGAAGPLVPSSGFSTLLNAARRVLDAGIDAEFVLVGEGEEEGELRRRAQRLRLVERLTFAGDTAVGLSFWDVLDVYCQPATVPTVGRDLARAMAHGLPSVASDIDGLRVLVRDQQTGLRVPPGDTNALARAILDLLADRPRAIRLGLDARTAILRDYDLDREANALAELYRSIIGTEPADRSETAAAS
jgi:glycosyltransferase involved in cell wall biosynthesis